MRSGLAVLLTLAVLCPPGLLAAPPQGTLQGNVTVDGRAVSGLELSLVDVGSGAIHRARSGAGGAYQVHLAPGSYLLAGGGRAGIAVGRGPVLVTVESGKAASADLELVSVPVPTVRDQTPAEGVAIVHQPVGCLLAGEYPVLEAAAEDSSSVMKMRIYFKSGLGTEWYFIEMEPSEGGFRGYLPRPQVTASPIAYYIEATTATFGEARTEEYSAKVVESETECEGLRLAPVGQPVGGLMVFSATTGAAAVLPAGFAAGGLAVGAAAMAAIVAGAGVAVASVTDVNPAGPTTTSTVPGTTTPTTTVPPTTLAPRPRLFTLTLTIAPTSGRVDVDPQGTPAGDLAWRYEEGTAVVLRASSQEFSVTPPTALCFTRWEGACRGEESPTCRLVMDQNKAVLAVFEQTPQADCPTFH